MKCMVSFGQNHIHEIKGEIFDKNCLAEIDCKDYNDGRDKAFKLFGNKYASIYMNTSSLVKMDNVIQMFPRGVIKI